MRVCVRERKKEREREGGRGWGEGEGGGGAGRRPSNIGGGAHELSAAPVQGSILE